MNTVKLDGQEYILRCDLNVLEKIHKKHGNVENIDLRDIGVMLEIAAWMVNEHFYYAGEGKSVTPDFIGAHGRGGDFAAIVEAVTKEIIDCMTIKN